MATFKKTNDMQVNSAPQHELYARCPSGFEATLVRELKQLHCQRVRPLKGGVAFFGSTADAYRACLWSRVATRIQLVLCRIDAPNADTLYRELVAFAWEEHVSAHTTIAIHAHGTNTQLKNSRFTALKVKDALVDRMRSVHGSRPDVDARTPNLSFDLTLRENRATLYLNLSGPALHMRGYRESSGAVEAPLKENLAAAILLAAGWDELAAQGGCFADPMCGSGTFAIEAALIAAHRAPGLLRKRWGFSAWLQHDEHAWSELLVEAQQALPTSDNVSLHIVAADIDPQAVRVAQANAQHAGVDSLIEFCVQDASQLAEILKRHTDEQRLSPAAGLIACNPPYGHRLQATAQLPETYASLALGISELPHGWHLAVITPDSMIDSALGYTPSQTIACYNGPLETSLRIYELEPQTRSELLVTSLAGKTHRLAVADTGSEQFAARLRKVSKERMKWAHREGVSAYRLYDSDLPDFALAIDLYEACDEHDGEQFIRVAEYQAPASVDAERADRRLSDALSIIPAVLDIDRSHLFVKLRRRDKGGSQYRDARGESFVIHTSEAGFTFEVDLGAYLDTGLFLDHRITRELLAGRASDTRFLNLFAYTGSASVYAAGGRAASTTTVDLSQTYLGWAERNMELNGFSGSKHRFVHADVLDWLKTEARKGTGYDLIFCDPPTFSNSKSMKSQSFEIQRDHVRLLRAAAGVLSPHGTIVFSCNKRKFKLDTDTLAELGLQAQDIREQTIPHDFARTPKVHHCWLIQQCA
ncbi:MAG: bifunctional 23S rRNA (guanine(2069)-N(7))-methyltransferase RlmK/23S rRNA (guanine(2445)-N(2))-methyltransferase RlmL [Atopobiaceae bacterium]|nr:bifunctional 23S rRNA (guanine(2069)-N(7))-methyltransferase RlmK/23S rRNA (guanine(2445)-N(2))-methyltransferase RlmL [Atopobiaceae bacterium]